VAVFVCGRFGCGRFGMWPFWMYTAPASDVEAVVRFSSNMAAAQIVAVDFNKMTSK